VASSRFEVPLAFAALLVTSVMGIGMYLVCAAVERRMTGWAMRGADTVPAGQGGAAGETPPPRRGTPAKGHWHDPPTLVRGPCPEESVENPGAQPTQQGTPACVGERVVRQSPPGCRATCEPFRRRTPPRRGQNSSASRRLPAHCSAARHRNDRSAG